jgi:hypothetical protein
MCGSARQKGVARKARVCYACKFNFRRSSFFPLIAAARIKANKSNGIAFAGYLGEGLRKNGRTLCEGSKGEKKQ